MKVETPPENVKGFRSNRPCHQCGNVNPNDNCTLLGCKFAVAKEPLRANEFGNGKRYRRYQRTMKQEGNCIVKNETFIPLTEREVAAIYLGRVRLANNSAIKQVERLGVKIYVPISDDDTNAQITCEAINIIDNMLDAYDYKFGSDTIALLTPQTA